VASSTLEQKSKPGSDTNYGKNGKTFSRGVEAATPYGKLVGFFATCRKKKKKEGRSMAALIDEVQVRNGCGIQQNPLPE